MDGNTHERDEERAVHRIHARTNPGTVGTNGATAAQGVQERLERLTDTSVESTLP